MAIPSVVMLTAEELKRRAIEFQREHADDSDEKLADLYDPLAMPVALVQAHRGLDAAVDRLYRKEAFLAELERVEFLFELYERYTAEV